MFNVISVGFSLACVAGGISVGVLYCFGGGAARRVGFPGGGGGLLPRILDRGVPRRFVNPNPI